MAANAKSLLAAQNGARFSRAVKPALSRRSYDKSDGLQSGPRVLTDPDREPLAPCPPSSDLAQPIGWFPYLVGRQNARQNVWYGVTGKQTKLTDRKLAMAKSPVEMAAAMIANLKEKTGKTLKQWLPIVKATKLEKHGQIVKFLKTEHGLTHGFANMIVHEAPTRIIHYQRSK